MSSFNDTVIKKIKADSFYGPLFTRTHNMEALEYAGFFDDEFELEAVERVRNDTQLLTTPLHKITNNLRGKLPAKTYHVLVTTGAFSPLHKGHITMMEQAKQALEAEGNIVVGGFIAPGHDSYVSIKKDGTATMDATRRIEMARVSLDESDWLAVDPWPALYVECEINFTTILERTEQYLARHLAGYNIQLWYVYGQDNEGFGNAFFSKPGAICVGRDDISIQLNRKNILNVYNQTALRYASSTKVRLGATDLLHDSAKTYISTTITTRSGKYGLRDDIDWATRHWHIEQREQFHTEFIAALHHLLENAFDGSMPIEILSLGPQQAYLNRLLSLGPILNLDTCLEGGERFDVSRLFNVADYQSTSTSLSKRPHSPNLKDQVARLTRKSYLYFDDDIVSGKTLRQVTALLKDAGIMITASASSLQASGYGNGSESLYDIDDARDFLLGACSGGLVVTLPNNKVGRVPYMGPYVSLTTRASIPVASTYKLSAELWALNARMLKKFAPHICVKHADRASQDFLHYSGFDDELPLYKVAEKHLQLFKNL